MCDNHKHTKDFVAFVVNLDYKILKIERLKWLLNNGKNCLTTTITNSIIERYPKKTVLVLFKLLVELKAQLSTEMKLFYFSVIREILQNYNDKKLYYVAYNVDLFNEDVFPLLHTILNDENVNVQIKKSLLLSVYHITEFKPYLHILLQKECPICHEELTTFIINENSEISILKCTAGIHSYHKHCLDKWVRIEDEPDLISSYFCPVCKTENPTLFDLNVPAEMVNRVYDPSLNEKSVLSK